jgi:cyclic pyranopterin phosphate synthase
MKILSHLDSKGQIKMVDVSDKKGTLRSASAEGFILMHEDTIKMVTAEKIGKGNVLVSAKIAGIQAAKQAATLIPLCHPLNLTWIDIQIEACKSGFKIISIVKAKDVTGVEMEALTAVAIAALTIYDMCKAIDKGMIIEGIKLLQKSGGKT